VGSPVVPGLTTTCQKSLATQDLLYAGDVVLFLRPSAGDIEITLDILQLFESASGLTTNLQKSSVLPIRCSEFFFWGGGEDVVRLIEQFYMKLCLASFLTSLAST